MDLLRLFGVVGGVVGSILSLVFLLLIPGFCEVGTGPNVAQYNCLDLGFASHPAWALMLGGGIGGAAALLWALLKPPKP